MFKRANKNVFKEERGYLAARKETAKLKGIGLKEFKCGLAKEISTYPTVEEYDADPEKYKFIPLADTKAAP
jgi:hypothetical protein